MSRSDEAAEQFFGVRLGCPYLETRSSGAMSQDAVERRAVPALELRAVSGRRLQGYAAVFGAPAKIGSAGGQFTESIRAGAFAASLASGSDVLALADHDPTRVLGRTAAGTLRLSEDSRGLAFDLDLPHTSAANDVLELVRSGNAGGMSFGFRVPAGGDAWSAPDVRELRTVDLHEISVVSAWPAYSQTSVTARSRVLVYLPSGARRLVLEAL